MSKSKEQMIEEVMELLRSDPEWVRQRELDRLDAEESGQVDEFPAPRMTCREALRTCLDHRYDEGILAFSDERALRRRRTRWDSKPLPRRDGFLLEHPVYGVGGRNDVRLRYEPAISYPRCVGLATPLMVGAGIFVHECRGVRGPSRLAILVVACDQLCLRRRKYPWQKREKVLSLRSWVSCETATQLLAKPRRYRKCYGEPSCDVDLQGYGHWVIRLDPRDIVTVTTGQLANERPTEIGYSITINGTTSHARARFLSSGRFEVDVEIAPSHKGVFRRRFERF